VIDGYGKYLANISIETHRLGYQKLLKWTQSFGTLQRAGVEGTGTYGAGLARFLTEQGIEVLEINRPDRSMRRFKGKSDPTDAESAARTVLSGQACSIPKLQSGAAEAMRIVSVARRSAVKARTQTINQLRGLLPFLRAFFIRSKPNWFIIVILKQEPTPKASYLNISRYFIIEYDFIQPMIIVHRSITRNNKKLLNFVSGKV